MTPIIAAESDNEVDSIPVSFTLIIHVGSVRFISLDMLWLEGQALLSSKEYTYRTHARCIPRIARASKCSLSCWSRPHREGPSLTRAEHSDWG